jgi:hypothetical protein
MSMSNATMSPPAPAPATPAAPLYVNVRARFGGGKVHVQVNGHTRTLCGWWHGGRAQRVPHSATCEHCRLRAGAVRMADAGTPPKP